MNSGKEYDVAISFLSRDEPLALSVESKLAENFNVFVFSKKQEEIAGSDGLETFRLAFRKESALVVVLYRLGWGKTRWTLVEETAIKERMFNEGWDALLFVSLDDTPPPKWLPETDIRLDFKTYGLEQLVGAVKSRAQKLGAVPHVETAIDRGRRLKKESDLRASREEQLQKNGYSAFQAERDAVIAALADAIKNLREEIPSLGIEFGSNPNDFAARGKGTSVGGYGYQTHPATKSRFVVREFNGRLILPTETGKGYIRDPQQIGKADFYFDFESSIGGWCWRPSALWMTDDPITTRELADRILTRLLDLENQFDAGEIRWRDDDDDE